MSKTPSVVLFYAVFCAVLLYAEVSFAQPGYKDFSWGDDLTQVKSKVPDLEKGTGLDIGLGMLAAYFYQYGDLYETSIPNPLSKINGKRDDYDSRSSRTSFHFLDGKLFAVSLSFNSEKVLQSLEKKYGSLKPKRISYLGNKHESRAWFEDQDRVIVHDSFIDDEGETVIYFDSKVYNKAAAQLVEERKAESKRSLNRVD